MATIEVIDIERSESLKERKEPSLGELNPLLYPPKLDNPMVTDALKIVADQTINEHEGLQPDVFSSAKVSDFPNTYRLVVRFRPEVITPEQFLQIEELTTRIYGKQARTSKTEYGARAYGLSYPRLDTDPDKRERAPKGVLAGWFMGTHNPHPNNKDTGILVFRDVGDAEVADWCRKRQPHQWFFHPKITTPTQQEIKSAKGYLVELREFGLYQTDIVMLITQLSSILAGKGLIDQRALLYDVYTKLNRLGLRKHSAETTKGLDQVVQRIEEVLINPVANLSLSTGIEMHPTSVLNVGIPGTGKTLTAERLLQEDTGVFIVPLDINQLLADFLAPPERRRILPRISQVFTDTQIPIILHIDDIEELLKGGQDTTSQILNLMAGVRESGFYILASTNHPEKIEESLLQPQRFGHLEYFGFPTKEVRRAILAAHVIAASKEFGVELFSSSEEREVILDALSETTINYTPRYLAEIANRSKAKFITRVIAQTGKRKGLTEKNIGDNRFTREDWALAFEETNASYNKREMEEWDERIKKFVERNRKKQVGFVNTGATGGRFLQEIERLAAIKTPNSEAETKEIN